MVLWYELSENSELCEKKKQVQDSDTSDSGSDVATLGSVNSYINGVKANKGKPIYYEMQIDSKLVKL